MSDQLNEETLFPHIVNNLKYKNMSKIAKHLRAKHVSRGIYFSLKCIISSSN